MMYVSHICMRFLGITSIQGHEQQNPRPLLKQSHYCKQTFDGSCMCAVLQLRLHPRLVAALLTVVYHSKGL